MSADDLLRDLEKESPALVRLAEAVSLAALVDPPLLRRARLNLVPEADAGLEADLWLSPLVQTRGPQGIVFAPEVADELRARLGKDSQRLEKAWEITRDLHRHLSPAVRLEEEVAWLSVTSEPDDERIEKLLNKALAALVVGERRGLAHWAARALPRLPARARKTRAARMLQTGAELRLGVGSGLVEERPEWLPWVAPADFPRVPVRVRLLPGEVELEAGSTEGESVLQVPRTDPLRVDVLWQDPGNGDERSTPVTLRPGERKAVDVPVRTVRLRTLLGEVYDLRPEGLPSRRLADQIIDFSEERARHRPFFGREEELAVFEEAISSITGGEFRVDGPTGIGKTAFLSRFLDLREERGKLPVHHFFRRGDPRSEDLAAAERSLVAQIAARFPEIAPTAPGRSLHDVLADLGERNLLSGEPLVVVLDGLEAILNVKQNDLARFQLHGLPWVVVVVTDQRLFPQTLRILRLAPPEEALRAFWEHHGRKLRLKRVQIEIALRASERNFGLAQVLRGRIENGFWDLSETSEGYGGFPQIWSKLGETLGSEVRNSLMGALAAAWAPLPDSVLNRLLVSGVGQVNPFTRRRFSKGEPDSALQEEVLRELIAVRIDIKEQHRRLAEAVTSDLYTESSTPQLREYGFRYGIAHWLEAGETERAYWLCTNVQFLTDGCREVGPEVVLRSLEGLLAWSSENPQQSIRQEFQKPPVVLIRQVLAERAPLLRATPEALPSLLYDHLRVSGWGSSEIRESLRFSSGLPTLRRKFPVAQKNPGPSRHRGSVVGCTFTEVEESALVLSWSTDGTLNLWRADDGELVTTLAGHTGEVTGCVLLPEDRAVSCSRDGTLRLWNLRSPAPLGMLCSHEGPVLGVVAIDSERVVSWSEDCTLRVWDVYDGRELRVLRGHDRAVTACAVVRKDLLVSGSADATVRLWSLKDGQLLRTYRGHQAAVTGIIAAPSRQHVLSCSLDRTVKIWPLLPKAWASVNVAPPTTSEEEMRTFHATLEGHSLGVLGLALSPSGARLASWSYDRTVRVWECPELAISSPLSSGASISPLLWGESMSPRPSVQLLSTLTGHTGAVLSCVFLADDMQLVSCSADRTLRLWRASTGEALDVFEGHERSVRCLAIEPPKSKQLQQIASGSDDRTLRLWSSETGLETTSMGGASEEISLCLATTKPGPGYEYVLFGNRRGVLEIRNVEEEERPERDPFQILNFPLQGGAIDTRIDAANRHYMVAWGWDGWGWDRAEARLRVLDLVEDPDVALLSAHGGPVLACAFTSTSERLLSASTDHTVCVWSVNPVGFNPIGLLDGHSGPVSNIKVAPGDQVALSASWDGTLRLWSLGERYPLLRVFEGHTDRVLACALSRDAPLAVSASADRTLRLWHLETGATVRVLSGHSAEVTGCAFTKNGLGVISRSLDGTLRAWDVPSKRGATVFEGHSDWVNAFALDEAHGLLYSCSEDRTVRAWDLTTGEPQGVVYGVAPFRSLVATRSGVCAGDEAGNLWVLEHERAVRERPEGEAA